MRRRRVDRACRAAATRRLSALRNAAPQVLDDTSVGAGSTRDLSPQPARDRGQNTLPPDAANPDLACLPALLQLGSAALPIGAFSHSLGLEAAVDASVVRDAATAEHWIGDYLELCWAAGEAPLWLRLYAAWGHTDAIELAPLNDRLLAVRESSELLLECTQTGHSLRQWLLALPDLPALRQDQRAALESLQPVAYATAHALAARALGLSPLWGLHAAAWGLLENLTTAAVKLVPLGQTQGQALLRRLALRLPQAIAQSMTTADDAITHFAPMLAIRSAQHESQYSRLFRS